MKLKAFSVVIAIPVNDWMTFKQNDNAQKTNETVSNGVEMNDKSILKLYGQINPKINFRK